MATRKIKKELEVYDYRMSVSCLAILKLERIKTWTSLKSKSAVQFYSNEGYSLNSDITKIVGFIALSWLYTGCDKWSLLIGGVIYLNLPNTVIGWHKFKTRPRPQLYHSGACFLSKKTYTYKSKTQVNSKIISLIIVKKKLSRTKLKF